MFPEGLRRATLLATDYFKQLADPNVDTLSDDFISETETIWMAHLKEQRLAKFADAPRVKACWAENRFNWWVTWSVILTTDSIASCLTIAGSESCYTPHYCHNPIELHEPSRFSSEQSPKSFTPTKTSLRSTNSVRPGPNSVSSPPAVRS